MLKNYTITQIRPYPLGSRTFKDSIEISAEFTGGSKCGINLRNSKTGKTELIMFPEECKNGYIYSARIEMQGLTDKYDSYNLYEDGTYFCDQHANDITGYEVWGKDTDSDQVYESLNTDEFDWSGDHKPHIDFADSFIYLINVRSFTKSPTSGLSADIRGTYEGVAAKIPYLKDLGVTAVEFMPVYEMNVVQKARLSGTPKNADDTIVFSHNGHLSDRKKIKPKINLWGFENAYYMAPRRAYAKEPENAVNELKNLIKKLHQNGIEVIMQFYFDPDINRNLITEALRHWVYEYHIDGIHLKGDNMPLDQITGDPLLKDTKIFYYGFDYGRIYGRKAPAFRTLSDYNDCFMYNCRRLLKGEDNTLSDFLGSMLCNTEDHGVVNYICNYDGFRLNDLVSYEHKRNEDNGENNTDGNDYNVSWNCGMEGKTRKKNILDIRNRQMKNALTMLFMSQGTPMIYSGDEFADTQDGNNNPYCQDNQTGWVNWKYLDKNTELIDYIKFLLELRKNHKILHNRKPFKLMDYKACGYPDLSYHGIDAWRPDLSNYSHTIGMLFNGIYDEKCSDDHFVVGKEYEFYYIAYNMHWTPVSFALPTLPDGMEWYLVADTYDTGVVDETQPLENQLETECIERSIKILIGKGKIKAKKVKTDEE